MAAHQYTMYTVPIFSTIAAVAFLGNVLVIYGFVTRSSLLRKPYNIFILNLAFTDLSTGVLLVFSRYIYLPPIPDSELSQELYCKFIHSARLLFMLGYISIYTCLGLTVERWIAVVKPQTYRSIRPSHAVKAIIVVWTWGCAINLSTFFRQTADHVKSRCIYKPFDFADEELRWVDFILQTAVPLVTIVILYCHILYTMVRLPNMGSDSDVVRRATLVAFAASSVLILGWMPGRMKLVLQMAGVIGRSQPPVIQYSLATLAFSNSAINPFLYVICSKQYRDEFKAIFCKIVRGGAQSVRVEPTLPNTSSVQPNSISLAQI